MVLRASPLIRGAQRSAVWKIGTSSESGVKIRQKLIFAFFPRLFSQLLHVLAQVLHVFAHFFERFRAICATTCNNCERTCKICAKTCKSCAKTCKIRENTQKLIHKNHDFGRIFTPVFVQFREDVQIFIPPTFVLL